MTSCSCIGGRKHSFPLYQHPSAPDSLGGCLTSSGPRLVQVPTPLLSPSMWAAGLGGPQLLPLLPLWVWQVGVRPPFLSSHDPEHNPHIHVILLCPCFILPHPAIMQKYDSHWADKDIKARKGGGIIPRSCSQMETPGGGKSPIPPA